MSAQTCIFMKQRLFHNLSDIMKNIELKKIIIEVEIKLILEDKIVIHERIISKINAAWNFHTAFIEYWLKIII